MSEENKREVKENHLSCGCGHCHSDSCIKSKSPKGLIRENWLELSKLFVSAILIIVNFFVPNLIGVIICVCAAIVCGYELIISFFKNLLKFDFFNENTLMLIASITAFVLDESFEGAFIVFLYVLGEFLESVATKNSRKKIAGLSELKSTTVHFINKNGMVDVEPGSLEVGSLIEVKSGELVPIDGILIGNIAEFDVKAITGESKFQSVENGGTVYSGSINVGNPVVIKTTKAYEDSTVEKIVSMVEGSLSKKAKSQKFISSFAKIYTPIVFCVAILLAVFPPLFDNMNFVKWVYKALSFLVVSCPCALVISVPLSFFVGIGGLAKVGVMVKGSNYLERLSKVKTIVFDKTGTLTYGNFRLEKIKTFNGFEEQEILDYVILLEEKSNHPIAKAFLNCKRTKRFYNLSEVKELTGKGICGVIDGKTVYIGNDKLMHELGVIVNEVEFAGSELYVAVNSVIAGQIFIVDQVKGNAKKCIEELKKLGVNNSVILSGDNDFIAKSVGEKVGVNCVYSKLLPEQKVEKLKQIKNESKGAVLYVGDGINDSPALAMSDVGLAMGGLGSDIAMQSADVVLMDDNLLKIPTLIIHSKKIKRTVIQNIAFSLGVKLAVMILSLLIILPVWVAMLADVGVMLLAICNSFTVGKIR